MPAMLLSLIVVIHNMQREAPRTLHSLSRAYQQEIEALDYEVIVVDNGSSRPLSPEFVAGLGDEFQYHYLSDAPPSPARAINFAVSKARGEFLGIMIDGAHLLTPGVLASFLEAVPMAAEPIIATRRFYLGPGQQSDTMHNGYNQGVEDKLLEDIAWPKDGYRLMEIGCFVGRLRPGWRSPVPESNCFFLRRSVFDTIGGADERFDLPGGGLLNLDMFRESLKLADTQLIVMHGEGSFHQYHGGVSTNTPVAKLERDFEDYMAQYQSIRGEPYRRPQVDIVYLGDIPKEKPGAYFRSG